MTGVVDVAAAPPKAGIAKGFWRMRAVVVAYPGSIAIDIGVAPLLVSNAHKLTRINAFENSGIPLKGFYVALSTRGIRRA
jgi:hypothetical protein